MIGKKFEIGVFASSVSLARRIQRFADRQNDNIVVAYEALDKAVPVGRQMELAGVEVIVSRRGTAHLLRENLRIPVLSLPLTSLAILASLKKAACMDRRILLPTFRNVIGGLYLLEDLLDVELIQQVYHDAESLAQTVALAREKGCGVVIGGSATMGFAKQWGLPYVEVETSEEDIAATIENAKSVAISNRQEKATAKRYRSIIDAASDGIVAVDEKGLITTINNTAREILHITHMDVEKRPFADYLPNSGMAKVLETGVAVYDKIEKMDGNLLVFNHLPINMGRDVIGGVSTFKNVSNVIRTESKVRRSMARGLVARYAIEDLIHHSAVMKDVVNIGRQFAKTESTILIMGETGTGKEILAQGIHQSSNRSKRPFVSVNCAALPEQLLESELFGYEEGAFTGSKKGGKPGRFEIAHGGTLFLDEIDTTPENVQIRLLRILQEREVMRVGGDRKIPIDVRVIAAAGKDLGRAVHEDRFREDLYFRLNVLRIRIPPLRERWQDIPVLLDHFVRVITQKYAMSAIELPPVYIDRLMTCPWPGNVRQLKNFAERLVLNCNLRCSNDKLNDLLDELYAELVQYPPKAPIRATGTERLSLKGHVRKQRLENESRLISRALEDARFCKRKAAEKLGISRTTLWRKIKAMGLE